MQNPQAARGGVRCHPLRESAAASIESSTRVLEETLDTNPNTVSPRKL